MLNTKDDNNDTKDHLGFIINIIYLILDEDYLCCW